MEAKKDKNFDAVKQRLLYFAEVLGIPKLEFYKKMGVAQSNFSGAALYSCLSTDKIINILIAYPDLNPSWLLLGHGEMLLSDINRNDSVVSMAQVSLLRSLLKEKDERIISLEKDNALLRRDLLDLMQKNEILGAADSHPLISTKMETSTI